MARTIDVWALRELIEEIAVDESGDVARCCMSEADWHEFGEPEFLVVQSEMGEHALPIVVDQSLQPGHAVFDGGGPN